jgi:hypothetical protein
MNIIHAALKIIVAHEDSLTGIRAVALLNKLSARLENNLSLGDSPWQIENSNLWNFECLQDLDLREQALAAGVDADIILISAGSQTQLPTWVKTWIDKALGQKQGRPSAMVAMFCGRQEPSAPWLRSVACLRQLAKQHGADFFCNLDKRPHSDTEAVFHPRFENDSEFSHDALADEFEKQRWGINK